MVGHDQVRVGGDPQAADVDAPRAQRVELLDQHLRVDHDPVADHAALAGVEDAGGDQVQLPLLAVAHDRVPGVVAALEAHHRVAVLGEQIDDLALPLIAPLGADYDYARHAECSVGAAPDGAGGWGRSWTAPARVVYASAFCLRASNSAWVIAPLSSSCLPLAICSVGSSLVATDCTY